MSNRCRKSVKRNKGSLWNVHQAASDKRQLAIKERCEEDSVAHLLLRNVARCRYVWRKANRRAAALSRTVVVGIIIALVGFFVAIAIAVAVCCVYTHALALFFVEHVTKALHDA